jgi:sugar lactone lactonase YvrE
MRFAVLAFVIPTLVFTTAATAPLPYSVPLPNDFAPEGIAVGTGSTFYVGSLLDGDIYRGDLRSGEGAPFVDAPPGRSAAGLKVDQSGRRLFVAGGPTGHAYVYDAVDGSPLADIQLSTTALVNDVVVTKDGAYFTDSANPVLYKVPIAPNGTLGAPQTIQLTGPASAIVAFPNLNGIAATPNGDTLLVGHSTLPGLFTVDPQTGASRAIAITGGSLTPGTNDGILLDGRTLWVVENFANRVIGVKLSPDLSSGEVVAVLTNADVGGLFRIPTTVAKHGNQLAIVNARFDLGLPPPLGPGAPPGTDYDVVVVPAR